MPSYSALSFILVALAAIVHTLPVDEVSARNGVGSAFSGGGGQSGGGSVTTASNPCTDPTFGCDVSDLVDLSLVKIGSEDAGSGGNAFSGPSLAELGHGSTNSKPPAFGSVVSGAGGQAPGGSITDNHPGMIELDSDNAGYGGNASSGEVKGLAL